jgi:hypothetical protein
MYLVQILLPCADNSGSLFPKEDFERLKLELASEFGGVTAQVQAPADGLWKVGPEESHDEIVIFEVMVEGLDIAGWKARRAELERRFRQERLIIRHMMVGII